MYLTPAPKPMPDAVRKRIDDLEARMTPKARAFMEALDDQTLRERGSGPTIYVDTRGLARHRV